MSVCLSGVLCKKADWIWMLFWVLGRLGPRMRQVDGVVIAPRDAANLGVDMERPIVTSGVAVQKCVKRSSCHLGW